jgi:hypothetical protein
MGTNESMTKPEIAVNDVIQLDPNHHGWGPLICIVDEVSNWGVRCYWLVPQERNQPTLQAYYRAKHGTYVRIGPAEWTMS